MKKNLLRTLVLSSALCLMSFVSHAQWVTIPDTTFVSYLQTNFPSCMAGNQMDTTCSAIVNAHGVYCNSKPHLKDITGIQYFDHLDSLICMGDSITFIAHLPLSLKYLSCFGNHLAGLPALPDSLWYLDCVANEITSLPTLPVGLTWLACESNQLTSLPNLPASLLNLSCRNNLIQTLPALPNALYTLYCGSAQLTSLPAFPNSLNTIDCEYSQVTTIPALPNALNKLIFRGGVITTLPSLPASLTELWTFDNQLTSLPTLPPFLKLLWCYGNQLTSLPALPATLCGMDCSNNHLSALPQLPDSLGVFNIYGNPNITCLPHLGKVNFFKYYNTGLTCLPNYPQANVQCDPPLSFTPLCDTFNSNGCSILWNIAGNVFYDASNNCVKNNTDTSQRNVKVQLWSGGNLMQQAYTGNEGFYSFDVDAFNTYDLSIDTVSTPFSISCPANNLLHDTITAADSTDTGKDFALKCKTSFDLTAQAIYGSNFRPANLTTVNIHAGDATNFFGAHCATGVSGSVTVTISGSAHYVSAASGALTPDNVSGNVLTWNVTDFGTVNLNSSFNILVQTDVVAALGSQICFAVSVTPTAGDNNPANNTLTHCFTVVGSFDPNEKEVYPTGNIDTATHWLTYTIHFQNTGTAEAQHIYVTDTLDSNIDAASFQLLAYSHQPNVQLKGNNLRFNFPNINLPDSNTSEPLSHGYVQYKVRLKDNLPLGTNITNTAFIYFDFNAPVVTNTTSNTISTTTGVSSITNHASTISIYPNPASTQLFIQTNGTAIEQVNIYNTNGSLVLAASPSSAICHLSTTTLPNGIYFIEVKTSEGMARKKFVKM